MSPAAVGLALIAAVLHAGWNAVVKRGFRDPLLGTWSIVVVGGLTVAPLWLVIGPPPSRLFLLLLTSAAVHIVYDVSMAYSYRITGLSAAYPLTRGAATVLAAAGGVVLLGDRLTPGMLAGIGLVIVAATMLATTMTEPRGVAAALTAGIPLATYTLLDGALTREVGSGLTWAAWLFPVHAAVSSGVLLVARGPSELRRWARSCWQPALVGGFGALGSYVAVLAAIERAPVGPVLGLRETSVVVAAVLGRWLLREHLATRRWLAVGVISAAAALMALS